MLTLDALSLEALEAAAAAGGSPAGFGPLASPDDLPLLVAVLDAELMIVRGRLDALEQRVSANAG
jgi:hypothetical protein